MYRTVNFVNLRFAPFPRARTTVATNELPIPLGKFTSLPTAAGGSREALLVLQNLRRDLHLPTYVFWRNIFSVCLRCHSAEHNHAYYTHLQYRT